MKIFTIVTAGILFILVLLLLFFGWIHGDGGNMEVGQFNINKIVKGQTTENEIKALFRKPPENITNSPLGEVWSYSRFSSDINMLFHWIEKNKWVRKLDVIFDEKGVVKDFKFIETKEGVYKNE